MTKQIFIPTKQILQTHKIKYLYKQNKLYELTKEIIEEEQLFYKYFIKNKYLERTTNM
jgi:hypothetical protein